MARIIRTCSPSSSSSSAIWNSRAARGSRVWNRWPNPGGVWPSLQALVHESSRPPAASCCPPRTSVRPLIEKPHARLDVAAVMRAERENAGRHAVLERRAGRRDVARRQRRRRRDAVIERRHQHGVQHPADRRRRQLAHQQQIDRVGERQPAHHLVERVAADQDRVRRDRRSAPICQRSSAARGCARRSSSTVAVRATRGRLRRHDRLPQPQSSASRPCRRADRRSRRARARCTCARSARDRRPACRSRRRDDAARPVAMPSGAATMQTMRMCGAPASLQQVERGDGAAAGGEHRIDHQHEARRRGRAGSFE